MGFFGMAIEDYSDYDLGIQCLHWFDDRARQYPNYTISFNDLLNSLLPHAYAEGTDVEAIKKIWIEGIGLASKQVYSATEDKIKGIMYNLADAAAGQIPANYNSINQFITGKASGWGFKDAVVETTIATAEDIAEGTVKAIETAQAGLEEAYEVTKDLAEGVAATAKGVASGLKLTQYIIPALLLGGVGMIFYLGFTKRKEISGLATSLMGKRLGLAAANPYHRFWRTSKGQKVFSSRLPYTVKQYKALVERYNELDKSIKREGRLLRPHIAKEYKQELKKITSQIRDQHKQMDKVAKEYQEAKASGSTNFGEKEW